MIIRVALFVAEVGKRLRWDEGCPICDFFKRRKSNQIIKNDEYRFTRYKDLRTPASVRRAW